MVAYIKKLAETLAEMLKFYVAPKVDDIADRFQVLREELDRLDPRDFSPESRYDFIECRRCVRRIAQIPQDEWQRDWFILDGPLPPPLSVAEAARSDEYARSPEIADQMEERHQLCLRLIGVLDAYSGLGIERTPRSFAFVTNADIREIVERDYRELALVLMPEGAWKSVVVMAGSILEAVLYDQLTKDAATVARAMASKEAPKKKGGVVKDISKDTADDEWKLTDLIEVAADLAVIPPHQAKSIDQVLRDYRNFVHPRKEIKREHPCREAEALQAKGALDGVCDHLDPAVK